MNKNIIVGSTILAGTTVILAWGIRKFRKSKKTQEEKVKSYRDLCRKHEEVIQTQMEFMDSPEAKVDAEFDKFRNLITDEDRAMFDENYDALRDIMLENNVDPIRANEIGTMFLASVVLRNNIENQHFSDHTRYMLEGNAELLPGAIKDAMKGFDPVVVDDALDYGRTAMDMVISGISREEYMYAQYH